MQGRALNMNAVPYSMLEANKAQILRKMAQYQTIYRYDNIMQLDFELTTRLRIVEASYLLYRSGARFATFKESECNETYWLRTEKGGFKLKENVLPSVALNDIFFNGSLYAFECAVAIVMVFYKGVLESIGERDFNQLFTNLVLYSGKFDEDLNLQNHHGYDFLEGDCAYFKNPDHHEDTPQWQGENTIIVGDDLYFGHGVGVKSAEGIIERLNEKRKENATESAYLTSYITRVGFRYLSQFYVHRDVLVEVDYDKLPLVVSQIGSSTYIG
ncbi:protein-glutamine gamma-glutamyltransferase [Priestia flexa]|uniref:protein-glutamine gamma-glutamyltransferase n=1 Tax=Priestia flexa TaxID=86664 RepID=UPI00227929C4|nr:protein-glutamine gamma-glutamyltransferase [Priestia flexa]UZW66282.1 protein-glutamine gamma-glutamyltransferase [Priestia flexa]